MTYPILEPAAKQVPVPVAQKTSSFRYSQIKPKVSEGLRSLLRSNGIGAYSTRFAATVSLEFLGADSPEWAALMLQGENFDNWTDFAHGCSVESLERSKRGATSSSSVHAAVCKAVERITGEPFPVEEVSAVEPDFLAEYGATQLLIADVRKKLLFGKSSIIGLNSPRWKESDHALGVPVHVAVTDISIAPVFTPAAFEEYAITAKYKGAQLPIGRVFFAATGYSIIFDARPFLWTGEEVMVGKKRIRLVIPKGDIERHLLALIAPRVELNAIAS